MFATKDVIVARVSVEDLSIVWQTSHSPLKADQLACSLVFLLGYGPLVFPSTQKVNTLLSVSTSTLLLLLAFRFLPLLNLILTFSYPSP